MISKYEIHPKEIVLGDPKYPDQSQDKIRPLVIISSDIFHQNSGFFACVGITTNKESDPYLSPLSKKQVENGQLEYDVQIMCKRITTLSHKTIQKKIGKITDLAYYKILDKIKNDILQL